MNTDSIVEVLKMHDDSYVLPMREWVEGQCGTLLCSKCYKLDRSVFPEPVDVWVRQVPKETSYSHVFHGGIAIIHVRMLDFLRPLMPDCVVGRCYWKDGSPMLEYRTVYMPHWITVRGADKRTEPYICPSCGIVLGIPWDPYVLRSEMPEGEVFQDQVCCLYLSAQVAQSFPWAEFRDVRPHEIPIRNEVQPDDPYPFPLPGNPYRSS